MKVAALLPLALAASALVIPDAETIEVLVREQQKQKPHPIWDDIKDPARFWEEVEERFDQATKYAQTKFDKAVNSVHDTVVKYSDDFETAFAAEAWMNSADGHHGHHGHHDDDDDDKHRRHHRRPHHGKHGEPPKDGSPEHDPEGPPRGPPHHRRPHHGPPDDDEPPHHGPPHHGPPRDGPPHHGPPHGPPRDGPPHHGPPYGGPPHHGPPHDGPPHHGPPYGGPPHHGPPHDGPPHHGPPYGGPPRHGPPHGGPPHHGPPHDGPPHHGPPHPPCHKFPHHPHIPHHFNKTVYEVITQNNFTTKLAKAINEYPDLIALLNTTNATYTVFAPLDIAFDKIPKEAPKPPKEFLKKLLTYHISLELYDAHRLLVSRTVPTALKAPFIGNRSQRISTQLGPSGGYLNFYSHVVAADFFGTNGVIHAIDSLLFPPPQAIDVISILPTFFSTFELGLIQTGLFDAFKNHTLHEGGTLFLPPNSAFALLGPVINGFLFSPFGLKYLRALLLYHTVPDITLYSDAIYKPGDKAAGAAHIPIDLFHIDLPTGLHGRNLSVNVARFGRWVDIKINGFVSVIVRDGVVADGVVHVVPLVIIPPREEGADADYATEEMDLEEFKARLEPYIEEDVDDEQQVDEEYIELELK